jgi:hypothetical protein
MDKELLLSLVAIVNTNSVMAIPRDCEFIRRLRDKLVAMVLVEDSGLPYPRSNYVQLNTPLEV